MKNITKIEKRVILLVFIALSAYVINTAKGYPSVPGALGPGFYPILAASILGGLSLIMLLLDFLEKGDFKTTEKTQGVSKVLVLLGMLIALVLFIQNVNPWVGICIFLCGYIHFFAKEPWVKSLVISLLGTVLVYGMTLVLQIRFR